ncbi:MAG: hypothetical protein AVDCRST_MAG45-1337 [uncultured Solirubrobacterales bacterium]|uniref:Peptidase M28 domain-containing protein n=1 Tax=uncultured Solirubrobacterales bacterium TaxID=768556 RepID=A0A6J4SKB8_9ACTN|nr:MAG: hypothetical protein AVDCRST_MAG45-1337 [uncultured Solirubrobacterales bacterium]
MDSRARIDTREEIEALVAYEGRGAGTDAERRAADHLARRLRDIGREGELEPVVIHPRFALTHALHAVVAIVGSVVSVSSAPIGAALVLLAALSTYADLTGRFFLFRRLTARRASQNVVSAEGGEKPGVLVLLAHHDAAHTGGVFRPRSVERRARIGARIRRPFGLAEVFFVALILLLGCCLVRLLVPQSSVLGLVQLVPTAALIASVPLLLDIVFGRIVPGANDNASGAATVLALAERYGGRLEHFDLWCVFAGAEEAQALGMREWVRRNRGELDPARTLFVDLDKVGAGTVHYARKEGLIFPLSYDARLLGLCDEIAGEQTSGESRVAARGYAARTTGDAAAARARGLRAVSISCLNELGYVPQYHAPGDTPERLEDEALEDAYEFCCELIERIDAQLGPEL